MFRRGELYFTFRATPFQPILPCCGIQLLEDGSEQPVVVAQAERAPHGIILGVRPLSGGNGICMETEVRLLPEGFQS